MKTICFFVNVDWYFKLHWVERALLLVDQGWDVHLLCNFTNSSNHECFEKLGITCHDINLSRSGIGPFEFLYEMVCVYRALYKIRPEIIHCITIKPNLVGGMLAKLFGIRVL